MIDNSKAVKAIAIKKDNTYSLLTSAPPDRFTKYLSHHFHTIEKAAPVKDLSNIEEVKKRYKASKDSSTTSTDL